MGNSNTRSEIIFTDHPEADIASVIARYQAGKIFMATESNVQNIWIEGKGMFGDWPAVVLPPGEENKKIEPVLQVWDFLSKNGADRKSLLINVGGGMLTDLAGFAASVFKRGIDFVNIPTTLLSQVDASVGGKTGINFNGLKNEVGTFNEPVAVLINTGFLETLDHENFLSGFAEMIKHGLIKSPSHLEELQHFDCEKIDYTQLGEIVKHSVEIKKEIVEADPTEKNIRKALNFGHTIGHAIESLAMQQKRPVLHGYAVAWGMVAELFLSSLMCNFSHIEVRKLAQWIKGLYGKFFIERADFEPLINLMKHDKKNESDKINFTLLPDIGEFSINQNCSREVIYRAMEYLRTY